MKLSSHHWLLILLVIVSFGIRLWVAMPLDEEVASRFCRPDTPGYLDPGRSLAEHGVYSGTIRPPGFPLLAALVFYCGGDESIVAFLMIIISTATLPLIYFCALEYGSKTLGLIAALLYGLNPTAIGNAPMMLSDTCFGFVIALQLWMFLGFWRRKKCYWAILGAMVAGIGTLIRPINLLWIFPALVLIGTASKIRWRYRLLTMAGALIIFYAAILPWMYRNASIGAGWCIDTNTGAMHHQNGAMILAAAKGSSYEAEKQRIIAENDQAFLDKTRFPDLRSQEKYRMEQFKAIIYAHPFIWLRQHFSWHILLPDIPTFLEVMGITQSGRGTLEVIKTQGLFAGIKHYFQGKYFPVLALIPLLLITAITYFGAVFELGTICCHYKERYWEIVLFLAFVEYYFFLPGPITVPRYQLPALPWLCIMAGNTSVRLYNWIRCKPWKKNI